MIEVVYGPGYDDHTLSVYVLVEFDVRVKFFEKLVFDHAAAVRLPLTTTV